MILELMQDTKPHDVRLVYLADAWLVVHRGHFLQEIDSDNIEKIIGFESVFNNFKAFFDENDIGYPWECSQIDLSALGAALKRKTGVRKKKEDIAPLFFDGKKAKNDTDESFPYSRGKIVDLLCGASINLKDLYIKDEYGEDELLKSFNLNAADEKTEAVYEVLGDDAELLRALKRLYDWALLADILDGYDSISAANRNTPFGQTHSRPRNSRRNVAEDPADGLSPAMITMAPRRIAPCISTAVSTPMSSTA